MPEQARAKPLELWFLDEARVGQKGTLTHIWAARGSRPRMDRDQGYQCAYIFGAVCPACDKGAAIVMPNANTHAMNEHLKEISLHVNAGAHAVVIIDGAGWHRPGDRLIVPENISLLQLPPYSPELNAQENIWQYLRQNYLAGRIFGTLDEIIEACCTAWNNLIAQTGRITSIASRDWLNCKNS